MTSTKARSAGLGAVATFAGFAASLGAGTAHAAEAPGTTHNPTPNKVCTIDRGDVEYSAVDKDSNAQSWQSAAQYRRFDTEPAYGFEVRLKDSAKECEGSIDVSLASYTAHGPAWETSHYQGFVDYATTTLKKGQDSHTLIVKLPGSKTADCYGQLDLYFGSKIYDGGTGDNHGPLPNFDKGVVSPPSGDLIGAWNGGTTDCDKTPPTTPPSSHPSSHPSSPPASVPSTPPTITTTTAVKPTSSAPTTAPSSTPSSPSTPTLAHTGSNAGAISLVALAFFGAGGTAMMASRKAAARKH